MHCDRQRSFSTSEQLNSVNLTNNEMKKGAVSAMNSTGFDRAELQTFCGVMDLPPPVK